MYDLLKLKRFLNLTHVLRITSLLYYVNGRIDVLLIKINKIEQNK